MRDHDRRVQGARETLTLKVLYPDASDLVADYTTNISRGGTFILTRRELAVGTAVRIELSFPGLLASLTLNGVVRWIRHDDDPDQRGVGVAFALEAGGAAERLADLMARIQAGDPDLLARTVRVLLVEDNPHLAQLLEEGLVRHAARQLSGRVRFAFDHVHDGRQALDRLQGGGFDLAIVDVYLPVLDGPSLIRQVRADAALARLPVIAVSAGGPVARDLAMAAGADFFVEKPMRLREILETVRKLVSPQ